MLSSIASDNANSNEQLAYNHPNASTATFSMHQEEKVNSLVQKADVVIRYASPPLSTIFMFRKSTHGFN